MSDKHATSEKPVKHTAGAFDVRTFIAALMGIYGVVLVLVGIFGGDRTADSTGNGSAINLTVGIGLLVFAGVMQGWATLRPTIVDEAQLAKEKADAEEMGGGHH